MPIVRVQTKKHSFEIYIADGVVHATLLTPPTEADAKITATKIPLTKSEAITLAARILEAAVLLPDDPALTKATPATPVMAAAPKKLSPATVPTYQP